MIDYDEVKSEPKEIEYLNKNSLLARLRYDRENYMQMHKAALNRGYIQTNESLLIKALDRVIATIETRQYDVDRD